MFTVRDEEPFMGISNYFMEKEEELTAANVPI